jgi:hypothetical protein
MNDDRNQATVSNPQTTARVALKESTAAFEARTIPEYFDQAVHYSECFVTYDQRNFSYRGRPLHD